MAFSDITIVRRSLTARLFSTITTALTVGIAVALLLVLLSMRDAAWRAFDRGSGNMHLLVSRDSSPLVSVLNGVFHANPPPRAIEWDKFLQLRSDLPLDFAIPVQHGDSFRGFPTVATTPEFFARFRPGPEHPWELLGGDFLKGPWEVVAGSGLARATGLRIGDRILLTHGSPGATEARPGGGGQPHPAHLHTEYPFTVVGILAPTGSAHDHALFVDLTSSWIIHAHDRRQREAGPPGLTREEHLTDADRLITGIYLRVATPRGGAVSAVLPQVFDTLRRDTSITVASPAQQIGTLRAIVGNIDGVLIAMAGAVLVSSGIAIMLALYNSMEQRRRQFAVLRVLGCSRGRLFSLVLTESAALGLFGAAIGIVLAAAGGFVAAGIMRQRLGLVIEPTLGAGWIVAIGAAAVLLAAIAGIVPALIAYRTAVARNLRPLG